MPYKEKAAHYRKCFLTDGAGDIVNPGHTLQSALSKALKEVPEPWQKGVGISNTFVHQLTETQVAESCLCGEIVYFEKGREIPLIDNEGGKLWRGSTTPKDAAGIERKFQEQALFFAIRENHVAVVQSQQLDIGALLAFLQWIIQGRAKLLNGVFIDLRNMPAREARQRLKDHKIQAIEFGEPLYEKVSTEVMPAEGDPPRKRKKFVHEIKTNTIAADILGRIGMAQPIIDKVSKNQEPGAIQVKVRITYHSRGEREAAQVLQSVAQTLGTRPELDPVIILSKGGMIKKDQLMLSDDISILYEGGRPGVDDACKKLAQWLSEQIHGRKVQ